MDSLNGTGRETNKTNAAKKKEPIASLALGSDSARGFFAVGVDVSDLYIYIYVYIYYI